MKDTGKKKGHVFLKTLLIVALAIIVGFGGSIGYQIYRANSDDESSTVIGSPVINEIGEPTGAAFNELSPTTLPGNWDAGNLKLTTDDVSAVVEYSRCSRCGFHLCHA